MQRKSRNLLVLLVAIVGLGVWCLIHQPQEKGVVALGHIYMLDVGQGDSFLIQAPNGRQLLIDGGKDSKVLAELAKVMPLGDRSIDVMIATHPDADHVGGLASVLGRYQVGLFMTTQATSDTDVYTELMKIVADQQIPAYYARQGMTLMLDKEHTTKFSILFPDRDTSGWETNTASVVGRLDIGKTSALFTGDSPISIEQYLVKANPKELNVDILKLGHHGSKTSSSIEYLHAASPILTLISAGYRNSYGHPAAEVVTRLASLKIPSISTIDKGTVTLSSDGVKWATKTEK